MSWSRILRSDVVPVTCGYLAFLWLLFESRRVGIPGRDQRPATGRYELRPLARHLGSLFIGGFAAFVLIVVIFYFAIGGHSGSMLERALAQGAVFTFAIVLPCYVVLSALEDRIRRVIRRPGRGGQHSP